MSGGSYNYLCFKDASQISDSAHHVKAMQDRLKGLGYEAESSETQEILDLLNEVNNKIDKISDVWRAVEWMDSGDTGPEETAEAIRLHRLDKSV
jgi:hypothetical protein